MRQLDVKNIGQWRHHIQAARLPESFRGAPQSTANAALGASSCPMS